MLIVTLLTDSKAPRSKTQELNRIANIVARAVLYGSKAEKFYIASHLDDRAVVLDRSDYVLTISFIFSYHHLRSYG